MASFAATSGSGSGSSAFTSSVGFELGYGKNKEARISVWQPRYLKKGEEGLEILDVEAEPGLMSVFRCDKLMEVA